MRTNWLVLCTGILGACAGSTTPADLSHPHDLTMSQNNNDDLTGTTGTDDAGTMTGCNMHPNDGQICSMGCPAGALEVQDQTGVCHCWDPCPVGDSSSCPCGRSCRKLTFAGDAGAPPTGACIPANGPGERCGADANNKPYGNGSCLDTTLCVSVDSAGMFGYCDYLCTGASDCPAGTQCSPLSMGGMKVCVAAEAPMGKAAGAACKVGDVCVPQSACDGATCKPQCNGPGDTTTCTGGTSCKPVSDPTSSKIAYYVCM